MDRRIILILGIISILTGNPVWGADSSTQIDQAGKALSEALKGEKGVSVAAGKKALP